MLGPKMSGANASDRFDIGGDPRFDPMVLFVHGRKSQVHHLVGQHPIRGKLRRGSVAADAYCDSPASIAKGHTVGDSSSFEGSDPNQDSRHRKAAVIVRHGFRSRFDPAKNVLRW